MSKGIGIQRDWKQQLTGCYYSFGGINNIIDPSNIDIDKGELADAINTDLDNTNSASRRSGFSRVNSSTFHSGWSNEAKTLAYMVFNSVLYEWDGDTAPYPIVTLTKDDSCEFAQINDVVVYSNGTDFGVIGGNDNQTGLYSKEFKVQTTGGRCLEFYNGRLYLAKGESLHCTDTFDVEHTDTRFNRVATFPHKITMCKRVEDGLWIGTEKYIYFLHGDDLREGGFEQIIVAKAGVVYGTASKTNAEYVPELQANNNVVIFLSTNGICAGGSGGKYLNLSFNTVSFDAGISGTATIRTENGISQYIVCFDTDSSTEFNPYSHGITLDINTL